MLFQKHPLSLYLLTFSEFWDRFSYYGIQALLVLYLTKVFLFSDSAAFSLYGIFTSLTFASTIFGGIIADKIIGCKNGILLGALLLVIGNLLLVAPGVWGVYIGFSTLICGIGFFKPNNATLAGSVYAKNDKNREGGFSIFYIGMNAGALLGPLVYGYISKALGWQAGFLTSACGTAICLVLLVIKKIIIVKGSECSQKIGEKIIFGFCVLLSIAVLALLMKSNHAFEKLLTVIGLATICGLSIIAIKSEAEERKHIIGLSILSFFCIFYFACSLQTATTLTLFVERNIDKNILGFHIPTMAFLSLQPFFIILLAPFMGKVWKCLSQNDLVSSAPFKVGIGLFLAALSFYIFSWSANLIHSNTSKLIGVILGNLVLGLGELCTLPILLSAITHFAPARWKSTMMGIFFLSLAFSGYFSGVIARITSAGNKLNLGSKVIGIDYSTMFTQIGFTALIISLIIFCCAPLLNNFFKLGTNSV